MFYLFLPLFKSHFFFTIFKGFLGLVLEVLCKLKLEFLGFFNLGFNFKNNLILVEMMTFVKISTFPWPINLGLRTHFQGTSLYIFLEETLSIF